MINRKLNDDLEGYVPLTIRGTTGQVELEALVDTGLNGYLSLSERQVADLDLEWDRHQTASMADEEEFLVSLYQAEAHWDGQWRPIEVTALGTTPLLGMQLLSGFRLQIDVVEDGPLTITRLPVSG